MHRLTWLAIFCLAGIGGLFAVRSAVGVTAVGRAPAAITADVTESSTSALAKGDRLPSRFFDSALPNSAVETIRIVPTEATKQESPKQSTASKEEIVSWHWHEGSKVVRRRRAQ
jgi:hypothetical protein